MYKFNTKNEAKMLNATSFAIALLRKKYQFNIALRVILPSNKPLECYSVRNLTPYFLK